MAVETNELEVTIQESDSWSRRLSITVPAERVQRIRGSVTSQITGQARMPGFRKGKLPQRILEQRFGASIDQETIDRVIQESFREALDREGLMPISQGQIDKVDYERGSDLRFEVEFEVRPEIELERTSGFTVSRPPEEIEEDDVDSVLERLRADRGTWEDVEGDERPDLGDQVMVQIASLDEDEEAAPRAYRFALGEGQAIPDVEQAIMTLAPGQEDEFTVTFPDDFPEEERRGEEQRLRIKLDKVQKLALPELDDEFAGSVGDFESLDALRERILQDLEDDARQRADSEVRRQLIDNVIEANPFEVPNSMVERYLDRVTGHSEEDGHKHSAEEMEQISKIRETMRPQAAWALKRMLIVESVASSEGLAATQDEIDARVEEMAEKHGRSASEVWIELEKSGQLAALESEITEDKVFDHLLAQNTVA